MPQRYAVRVVLDTDAAELEAFVGRWATVVAEDGRAVLEMKVDSLEWPMFVLANVAADFTVESPPELAEAVSRAAARFQRAGRPVPG